MFKTYFKISLLVLLTVLVVPCFVSCGDDDGDTLSGNLNSPQYETVSGKYEITDSSSPYASVELGASGDYIIIKRGMGYSVSSGRGGSLFARKASAHRGASYGNLIYGTYTQVDDKTFNLEGFGRIQLVSANGQGITNLVIKPQGGSEMTFKAKKAATMKDDDLTNALCRTWKVVQVREKGYDAYEGHYDDIYIPEENPDDDEMVSEIMFSKSGTCLNLYCTQRMSAFFWKWENMGKRQIRSSMDNVWYNDDDGIATVTFTADNKLTLCEYYVDNEDGEWYEITVELVEKNPSVNEDAQGDIDAPADSPVGRVFTGKLLNQVDDHGLDKFVYKNGFLTQVICEEDGYTISFEYKNRKASQSASEADVRYTKKLTDGSVEYVYDVWLNDAGFAERIDSKHYDRFGLYDFQFQSTCKYDKEGHLVFMNEGREEREYSLSWEGGDLCQLMVTGSVEYYHSFSYGDVKVANENNLMFFYDIYHMDIEELKYLYWAGLLGVSTKHLVTMAKPGRYDSDYSLFKWEVDKVSIMEEYGNSVVKEGEIPFWFAK